MNSRNVVRGVWRLTMLVIITLGLIIPARQVAAQSNQRCFVETGYCISGRFLEYWNAYGGLAVFGFPLSAQAEENGLQTQYFERQRFELHPENARPYDVLLGRLGAERLSNAQPPQASGPANGCVWFPETKFNVCNKDFQNYWRTNGLELDGRPGKIYQESLALFGLPISGDYDYMLPTGEVVIAQWFERARFEWHPNNPAAFRVLLGRLGAEARPWAPGPYVPTPAPTPAPPATQQVNIFLISQGGGSVGCGDSVVPVVRSIAPTNNVLTAALNELFNLKTQTIGESGLYNALYQSDIRLDRVVIVNGEAQVSLSGNVRTGGVCDKPRVIAQIEQTVRQFSTVTSTKITLNGAALADAIV